MKTTLVWKAWSRFPREVHRFKESAHVKREVVYTGEVVSLPSLRTVVLPNIRGSHVTDEAREKVTQSCLPAMVECGITFDSDTKGEMKLAVMVGGWSNLANYISNISSRSSLWNFLVVDKSPEKIIELATALDDATSERIRFINGDPRFVFEKLIPEASVQLIVFPTPIPYSGGKNSHNRLLTTPMFQFLHRALKPRTDDFASEANGFLTFSDSEPLAEFTLEQLIESNTIIPWTRKPMLPKVFCEFVPQSADFDNAKLVGFGAQKLVATPPGLASPNIHKRQYYRPLHH